MGKTLKIMLKLLSISKNKKKIMRNPRINVKRTAINRNRYTVLVRETNNNIFVTLSTLSNKLIANYSSGNLSFHGPKKKTPLAGELLGKKLKYKLSLVPGRKLVTLLLAGRYTLTFKNVVRGLQSNNIKFITIKQVKNVPHNGVRLKKKKRL